MSLMIKAPTGGLPTLDSLSKAISNASAEIGSTGDGTPLLRLSRSGYWVFGQNNDEAEADAKWAINPYSYQHGYVAWGDGELLGETMGPITAPRPLKENLKDVGVRWDEQYGVQLQCVSGSDSGLTVTYKTNSFGGKRAIKELLTALGQQLAEKPECPVAVVTLGANSYQHKKYGQVFNPEITITGWVAIENFPDPEDLEEDEELVEEYQAQPELPEQAESRGTETVVDEPQRQRTRRRK